MGTTCTTRTVRIQVASDLHLEHLRRDERLLGWHVVDPAPEADLLVLAGDIHNGADAVRAFADWPVPVLLVPGNHEAYGASIDGALQAMRAAAAGTRVRVLERDTVVVAGVRFVGTTLWSDASLYPGREAAAAGAVESLLADYRRIASDRAGAPVGERLSWAQSVARHHASRDWLRERLEEPFQGPTVVVTHHLPSARSVHPRFADSLANAGFASDLDALMGAARVRLWIHGHTHDSFDYALAGTRVVCNPRGYARGLGSEPGAPWPALVFENAAFDPSLVVAVEAASTTDAPA